MSTVQPLQSNGLPKRFGEGDKDAVEQHIRYYTNCSETGLDGPNQVLASDVDVTTKADGRVRIKMTRDGPNSLDPLSVPGMLMESAKKYPDHPALVSRLDENGNKKTYTYKEYEAHVRTVAKAFIKLGLQRYHGVCILGFNCPEWFISEMAAIYAGGIVAGIYTTNSPEACRYCAERSRANVILVEDEKQLSKILQVKADLPHLKTIIQYEGTPKEAGVLSWEDVIKIGEAESDDKLNAVLKSIAANECCSIVYTSGTVGNPKAVMLSHDNLMQNARMAIDFFKILENQEQIVSYLPMSHVAAQIIDVFCCGLTAGTVHFADKNALKGSLIDTLTTVRPTIFLGVPRVWEKIYEKMQAVGRSNGMIKTWIGNWAKSQGLHYNMSKMNGVEHKTWGYAIARWLIFSKVRAALGFDRCRLQITGAAPISVEVKKYFMSLDLPIVDVYGMSECAGCHSASTDSCFRLGTVGVTMKGFFTKLHNMDSAGEGEVCMAGRHVFMGYLDQPDKTEEAIDENGWLHSGDLGKIDKDGFLYITGRIKELIITAGGENVPPVHIEQLVLAELPALSNAFLVGDQKRFLTMLVTLKTDMNADSGEPLDTLAEDTLNWAKSIGSNAKTVTEVLSTKDPAIHAEVEKAIKRVNDNAISNAQRVQKFRILPHDFSVPTGELGPTLKIRRNVVAKMYEDIIEEMYK